MFIVVVFMTTVGNPLVIMLKDSSLFTRGTLKNESGSFRPESRSPRESFRPYSHSPRVVSHPIPFHPGSFPPHLFMENTIANIRILDVVRLVHGYQYFIFVFLIINMLS